MNQELDRFNESDFGRRCAEWTANSVLKDGPILYSTLGQRQFLPETVTVSAWVASIPGVKGHPDLLANDKYCESALRSPDPRPKRSSPSILPEWMRGAKFVSKSTQPAVAAKPFFIGKVHFKKSGLVSGQYVVTDVRSCRDGFVSDIPLFGVDANILKEGEFVVGFNPASGSFPFLNQQLNSAVQILPWRIFKESKVEVSAEVYFRKNSTGVLTASFADIIGNADRPGHVIIADKSGVYLKGFSSIGNGVVRYFNVEKYDGDFIQKVSSANQPVEWEYHGNEFAILVPVPKNKYAKVNKHSVIDCEGWVPLANVDFGEKFKTAFDKAVVRTEDETTTTDMTESVVQTSATLDEGVMDVETKGIGEDVGKTVARHALSADEGEKVWQADELKFLDEFSAVVKECGFIYDDRDIARLHTSVKCGRMIVLGGAPGVGKSSIIELYSRCVGGEDSSYFPIVVSPSWAEPADILGDVDFSGKFRDSRCGLARYVRDAGERKNLHSICFEEMNLACAEHYFSDLMQVVDKPVDKEVEIRGYDRAGLIQTDPKQEPSSVPLKMAPNVRVFGTCNFDITTHPFSARFYNRCSYIELLSSRRGFPNGRAYVDSEKIKLDVVPCIEGWRYPENKILPDVTKVFDDMYKTLNNARLYPSPRVLGQMEAYIISRPPIGDERRMKVLDLQMRALDEALAQYVFPKYVPDLNSKVRNYQKVLRDEVSQRGFTISSCLLEEIEKRLNLLSNE